MTKAELMGEIEQILCDGSVPPSVKAVTQSHYVACEEIERLRAALKPIADLGVGSGEGYETENYRITRDAIRNARLALE